MFHQGRGINVINAHIKKQQTAKTGNVFILQHSFFQNVVQFGCTSKDPNLIATKLTKQTRMPGEFSVISSLFCDEPCEVKKRVTNALKLAHYVEEFYEISPEAAFKVIQREILRIDVFDASQRPTGT